MPESIAELTLKVAILEERLAAAILRLEKAESRQEKQEDDTKGLNRTLIGFGITVAGAAIGFAITTIHFFA